MIEVAHRQHNTSNFRFKSSKSASASHSTSASSPLSLRHLKTPPSPLINSFNSPVSNDLESKETTQVDSGHTLGSNKLKDRAISGRGSALTFSSSPDQRIEYTAAQSASSSTSRSTRSRSMMSASVSTSSKSSTVHRIRRGQKMEDFQPPALSRLPPVQTIDSAFQLQEYLSALLRHDVHDIESIIAVPQPSTETLQSALESEKGKSRENENPFGGMEEEAPSIDTDVWIYEQLRRIVLDFSTPWLIMLQKDCDKKNKSCEAMNADDWMYLCASHGEEKQCCAIDYMIHTLDGTTALLNSQRHFPSRTYIPTTSLRHFGSACRRISRIFVHAYEHHRDIFEACEAETALYARFLALVQTYDLIQVDSLPRLGKGDTSASKDSKEDIKQGNKVEEGGGLEHNRRGEKGLLFEADVAVPTDEDEEEEEEEEEEGEDVEEKEASGTHGEIADVGKEGDSQIVTSIMESRPQRSDSVASRITAIDLSELTDSSEAGPTTEVKQGDEKSVAKIEVAGDGTTPIDEEVKAKQELEKPQSTL